MTKPPSVFLTLLLTLLLACSGPLRAAVGRIDSLEGEVRIISKDGERAAKPGLEVNEGDTMRTGTDAWALLGMSDGATLTLRPSTVMRIDAYRYAPDGDPSQNRSLLALVRGALRVITGVIGQTNRQGYSISTQGATIGIRGTDHEPSYYPPGDAELAGQPPGTYDKVNAGETFIRNPRGEVVVRPGRSAFVHHSARLAPQLLQREPPFYRRHAQFDRRAAARRAEIHRRFEQERLRQKPLKRSPDAKRLQEQRQEKLKQMQQKRERQEALKEQQRKKELEQRRSQREAMRERYQERAPDAKTRREQQQEKAKKETERRRAKRQADLEQHRPDRPDKR